MRKIRGNVVGTPISVEKIAERIGGGTGEGAKINDNATTTTETWSSKKISDELAKIDVTCDCEDEVLVIGGFTDGKLTPGDYQSIDNAFFANKEVILRLYDEERMLFSFYRLSNFDLDTRDFVFYFAYDNVLETLRLSEDGTIRITTEQTGGGGAAVAPLFVTVSGSMADHSSTEIINHINKGGAVYLRKDNSSSYGTVMFYNTSMVYFIFAKDPTLTDAGYEVYGITSISAVIKLSSKYVDNALLDQIAVLCTEQALTPEQQAQARANIGAAAVGEGGGGGSDASTQTTDAQEHAPYSEELASASGWTTDGWTGDFENGFTHTSGNTNPLIFAMPESTGTNMYQVTFESSVKMTDTNLFVTIGGSDNFPLYGMPEPYSVGIQSVEDGNLMFIPESGFTGKLTNISVKRITGAYESIPSKSVTDSTGQLSFEMRGSTAEKNNVFIGEHAGQHNTNGFGNVAMGADALATNTSGFWNIGVGYQTLMHNTVGSRNVAAGYGALSNNKTGHRNIALGSFSLLNNKTGAWNISIGADCMDHNVSGNENVAIGFQAMYQSQGANGNVAIGKGSMQAITDGKFNIGVGYGSMPSLTTGEYNVCMGYTAMNYSQTAGYNVAIGFGALYQNLNGQNNVCIGTNAGSGSAQRSFAGNVCIGQQTGKSWTSGVVYSTYIGAFAGDNITTGHYNICIGYQARAKSPTASYQLNIGNLIYGDMTAGQKYAEIDGGLQINALPTTDPGISGRLWNDNGTVKVSAG